MQLFSKKLFAGLAVAVVGAGSLLAAQPARRHGGFMNVMATYLNLTDAQKTQAQSIFQEARQSAKPIAMQLRDDRKALQTAAKAGSTDQIQQLAAAEGAGIGKLAAIRASAFAKMYKTLTPDQQQKLDALQQARGSGRRGAGFRGFVN